MKLRRATPADAAPLAELLTASWRVAYRGLVPDDVLQGLDVIKRTERFRNALAEGAEETYLAEQDDALLGFMTLRACRDEDLNPQTTGEIWGIYLAPSRWRSGIGTFLCRTAESILRAHGFEQVTLWVLDTNDRARRFYEAMGFRPDGAATELTYGEPRTVVRYRKRLIGTEREEPADPQHERAT